MENIEGFISTELRFPTETSKKKKRYITFRCSKCDVVTEKMYVKSRFVNQCESCLKGAFTTEEFIKKGRENFGNKYDYSLTKYKNKRSNVTIICPVHGEFTQKGQEHLDGHGCKKCGDEQRSLDQQLSIEVWEERLNSFPKITFKGTPKKLGYHTKVLFTCEDHGDFEAPLGSLLVSTHVCKKCSHFSHQQQSIGKHLREEKAYVYYVYFPELKKYKIGVTTSIRKRITSFGTPAVVLLKKRFTYLKAAQIEHKLMNSLEEFRYKGSAKLLPTGNTELLDKDVYEYVNRALQE